MPDPVNQAALDTLFNDARTRNGWHDKSVPEQLIRKVYDLTKMGPTSANCSPARFFWVHSDEARAKLMPLLMEGNRKKTKDAPWVVIIAWDWKFNEKIPQLFPHNPGAKDWFASDEARFDTGFRNGTLQAAYLMMAARAMGFDCGPMSGFDKAGVEREFFQTGDAEMKHWRANFVCSIGYGNDTDLFPRSPRLSFEEACRIA